MSSRKEGPAPAIHLAPGSQNRPAEREFGPRQFEQPQRCLACVNASLGRLRTHGGPPFHRKMEGHLADIIATDSGIQSVHFWEVRESDLKNIFWVEGSGQSRREPFIPLSNALAQRVLGGEMAVFDGKQMALFSLTPDDHTVREGNGLGLHVAPGCWVPVYTSSGGEAKVTHMLSATGDFIGKEPEQFTRQEFFSAMARIMGMEYDVLERGKDPLTGLLDVRFFKKHLIRACIESILKRKSFGVLHADVDDFKRVNDTYGHMAGDDALVFLSGLLQSVSITSGRLGGDELALILYGLSDIHALEEKAFNLHCQLNPAICTSGTREMRITASCGISGSFQWEALKGVKKFPDGPKEKMLENIRLMLDQMPKLREDAEPEIARLRSANRSPSNVGEALELYAQAWGNLLLTLAEISAYLIKITGRNGVAMPVVEGDTLGFKIICQH